MEKKWVELFQGMMNSEIPFDGSGYILATHFKDSSNYTIFEIIAFKNVKNFIGSEEGVTFYSDGYKIFFLYEPVTYRLRFMEPYLRETGDSIPQRWKELYNMELPSHDRLFISKEPYMSYGSFTIGKPDSGNFVYYFFDYEETRKNMEHFLGKLLVEDLKIPRTVLPQIFEYMNKNLDEFNKSR